MKGLKGLRCLLAGVCIAGAFALPAYAASNEPAQPAKAKTVAELAARYDSNSCKECHPDIYDQWQNSLHAKSILGTPRTAPTILTAIDKGVKNFAYSGVKDDKDLQVKHLMICAKCHLPQLEDATDDVAKEIVATIRAWQKEDDDKKKAEIEAKITSLNIGCTVCHNQKAIIHKWADGFPQSDTVYSTSKTGAHDDAKFNKMGKAPALKESIFCGQCHGLGPNFELEHPSQCATLYGSYLYAYVPEGGHETCQDCHMKKSGLGHDMQAYRSEKMRKMSMDVEVDGRALFWRKNKADGILPLGIINVEIMNKTGHVVPDG